jgi:hypothetical protein
MDPKNMINNHMDSENTAPVTAEKTSPPNESTGIYVRGFVKIIDPETGKVYVETAN